MENAAHDLISSSSSSSAEGHTDAVIAIEVHQCVVGPWQLPIAECCTAATNPSSDPPAPAPLHCCDENSTLASISSLPCHANISQQTTDAAGFVPVLKEDGAAPQQWQLPSDPQDGEAASELTLQTSATKWMTASFTQPPPANAAATGSNLDLEKGLHGAKIKEAGAGKYEEDEQQGECRVCHLAFDTGEVAGEAMELGCDCKDDLALAHRHCAEAWFKIKGNRTCEICGTIAQNIMGIEDSSFMDQWNDRDAGTSAATEPARCWQSQPLCNFLLACMVVAFILPWLFRVTIV